VASLASSRAIGIKSHTGVADKRVETLELRLPSL
jgi:hypothetical protein